MTKIAIQISPEAKAAYFSDYLYVAEQELNHVIGSIPFNAVKKGGLEFFELDNTGLDLDKILRLSFVQGIYAIEGNLLRPLELTADYHLHEDFVFGSKFKGKTNERLTQLLINVGLATIGKDATKDVKLLDPMCGRATTLLWAMRYGLQAKGIEQDTKAIEDIHRNLKKWTKLHRQKHKLSEGFIGGQKKKRTGQFLDFNTEQGSMRIVIEDARKAEQVFKKEKFDLLISDLPYGIQHFTTEKTRNPLTIIEQCIKPWKTCLKKTGAIVLAFNSNNPKRIDLINAFEQCGFKAHTFSARHRMSESIIRDILVLQL